MQKLDPHQVSDRPHTRGTKRVVPKKTHMTRNSLEWHDQFVKCGALWTHDGDMTKPHVALRSGLHSDRFCNSRFLIRDKALLAQAALDLASILELQYKGDINEIDGVVGPQTGATDLAKLLAIEITTITGRPCFSASPAKDEKNGIKSMVFSPEEAALFPGSPQLGGRKVVVCEDVYTTGASAELAANAVRNAGGVVLPVVLMLVNRSGLPENNGNQILALTNLAAQTWEGEAGKCPFCTQGSPVILDPKDHWKELTGFDPATIS